MSAAAAPKPTLVAEPFHLHFCPTAALSHVADAVA